jgi:hypothetical protein
MAITTGPLTWYDKGIKNMTKLNVLTDDIRVALTTSSYTPNAVSHEYFDVSVTNELPTAAGYTAGGQALSNKTLTEISAGLWGFDSDDVIWTATGGDLAAYLAILYNNTPASNKQLLAYAYLNYNSGTPLTVTTLTGFDLSLLVPANGWFLMQKVNA